MAYTAEDYEKLKELYGPGKQHFCNGVTGPAVCCPTAHGHPDSDCDCHAQIDRMAARELAKTKVA